MKINKQNKDLTQNDTFNFKTTKAEIIRCTYKQTAA